MHRVELLMCFWLYGAVARIILAMVKCYEPLLRDGLYNYNVVILFFTCAHNYLFGEHPETYTFFLMAKFHPT